MVNLKQDLIDTISRKKFFAELELGRLAQEPNMNYELKISLMEEKLQEIAISNSQIALANTYFPDAAPAPTQPNVAPTQVHNGQTHGE